MIPTEFLRETVQLVKQIETRFLELGARLYKIREEKLWYGSYDSFNDFLQEIKLTPGNASILSSVHKNYVLDGGIEIENLAGIPYSNLYESIPFIETKGLTTALVMASTLTRGEITAEKREAKGCTHDEHITICVGCKKRIYDGE